MIFLFVPQRQATGVRDGCSAVMQQSLSVVSSRMQLTREQQLALTSDRHLAVLANAGSGKTAVLVQRYTQLLLDGVDVRDITAITFTRKAAGEMLQRVAKRLDGMLQDPANVQNWPHIKHVRERLNTARISTIHSFCARLLRDYPIEANVNPAFTELAEHEGALLKKEAISDALEQWLTSEQPARKESAFELFRALGRKRVEQYLLSLLAVREVFNTTAELYAGQSDSEIAGRAFDMILREAADLMSRIAPLLRESVNNIERSDLTKAGARNYDAARAGMDAYQPVNQTDPTPEQVVPCLSSLRAAAEAMFTQKGEFRKMLRRGVERESLIPALERELGPLLAEATAIADLLGNRDADLGVVQHARTLIDIAADAWRHVEEVKDSEGQLDFDDLQLRALDLLQNAEVRTSLQRRLRHVMIDEFQDTNALQYAIAQALLTPGDEDEPKIVARERARLFIVGDPKQSIYGFRGSDVRVFEQARKEVKQFNLDMRKLEVLEGPIRDADGKPLDAEAEELLGDIRLNASFRLLPVPAAFVNRICGKDMRRRDSDFDIEYEDLVCARSGAPADKQENQAPAEGSVELLISRRRVKSTFAGQNDSDEETDSDAENDEEQSVTEADLIARRIAHAVEGRHPLTVHEFKGQGEVARPAEYGDIAILSRGRNKTDELTAALRRYNIPFVLSGGRGYYETQELLDMRSILLFLQNQANDAALAAALRSPFFGVVDTELFEISVAEGSTLWEKFNSYMERESGSTDLTERLKRTHRILTELTPLAQRLTIPVLIRWILDRTAWRGLTAGYERREQMHANVEKLLDLARGFEERGFRNLHDFAAELDDLARHSVAEGEADIAAGTDAVKIMTVHAAKGLEFPIVFLYRANFSGNTPTAPLYHADLGMCFPGVKHLGDGFETEETGPLFYLSRRVASLAEQAEEKRILYVALTRARDHLLISATIEVNDKDEAKRSSGFLPPILSALDISESEVLDREALRFYDTLPVLTDGRRKKSEVSYSIPVHRDLALPDEHAAATEPDNSPSAPMLLTEAVLTHAELEYYSASQLDLFKRNPAEYIRVYRLGLPPTDDDYWQSALGRGAHPEGDQDAVLGTQAGTLLHAVLEALPAWIGDNEVNNLQLERHVERAILATGRPVTPQLRKRVLNETRAIGSNEFIRRYAEHMQVPGVWQAELPFQMFIDESLKPGGRKENPLRAFLIGVLDALVFVGNDQYEVWDWKSNRVLSHADMDELLERYRMQLEVYLYFLMRRFPNQDSFTARLLFTRRAAESHDRDDWTVSLTRSRSRLEKLESQLTDLMRAIRDTGI